MRFYIWILWQVFMEEIIPKHNQGYSQKYLCPYNSWWGIKSIEDARDILKCGAEKIAITAATKNPDLIKQISNRFGSKVLLSQ